jgi:hypothetical protein
VIHNIETGDVLAELENIMLLFIITFEFLHCSKQASNSNKEIALLSRVKIYFTELTKRIGKVKVSIMVY